MDEDLALRQIRTAGSISISPELFEKLYLSPKNEVKGELRKTFGNPTPLQVIQVTWRQTSANHRRALVGFLLSLTPLSWTLMGWRGAGASGSASIGWYFFAGGLLMVLGGLGEVRLFISTLNYSVVNDICSGSSATHSPLSFSLRLALSGSATLPPLFLRTELTATTLIQTSQAALDWNLKASTSDLVSPP